MPEPSAGAPQSSGVSQPAAPWQGSCPPIDPCGDQLVLAPLLKCYLVREVVPCLEDCSLPHDLSSTDQDTSQNRYALHAERSSQPPAGAEVAGSWLRCHPECFEGLSQPAFKAVFQQ